MTAAYRLCMQSLGQARIALLVVAAAKDPRVGFKRGWLTQVLSDHCRLTSRGLKQAQQNNVR